MSNPLQCAGQWLFLRAEAAFNAAFGDRLNPFYHLGTIAFFLYWVVAATGLYLYIFFETSTVHAYASVERLTHAQWWAGGMVRSVHRYASDALVLTMLLHMARHFCFDRHRGLRWFSWITGVLVLWLVYAAGINGFMLPWDRVAQLVVTGTAELLDHLPLFDGRLVRNFLYPGSVNDRLFSLLAFMHIGIPLVLLLFLWVHIQRVPRAATLPPRAIWLPLLVTLVVLSVLVPVMSGAPADLASIPAVVALDWYYLAVFALMYKRPVIEVWMMLGAVTLLLLALPWLPPRRDRAGPRRVSVHPGNREITARPGETLLEAGLRAGVVMPYECRNGGCGVCKATLLQGRVLHNAHQRSALPDAEQTAGRVLLCCAVPMTDVELEIGQGSGQADSLVRTLDVTVSDMRPVGDEVMILRLALPPGESLPYRAGQYFNVVLEDGARRAFSFASAPESPGDIEVHVRLVPGGRFTGHVFGAMRVGERLRIEGPLGKFVLRESERPILFVAGATGFAPVKSLLDHAFATGLSRPMVLYWGVRRRKDLYMAELPERWASEHSQFRFVPVLSAPEPGDDWRGRTGLVHEAILADYPDLSGFELYACGSVAMVESARPAFMAQGLSGDLCFSDAFFVSTQPTP